MTSATKTKASQVSKAARQEKERRGRERRVAAGALVALAAAVVIGAALLSGGDDGTGGTGPAASGDVTIDRAAGPQLQVGDKIPAYTAPMLGGGTMTWDAYAGTPTVLSIWAPWCPHCQVELPRLSAGVDAHPGIQMVSVATAIGLNPGPTPEEYLASEGLTFPVGLDDGSGTILHGMGVESFPTTYYVDSTGTVVDVTVGEVPPDQLGRILDDLVPRGP